MVFSSLSFLFGFLPVVLAVYLVLMRRRAGPQWSNAFLLIASLFFYSWGEAWLVLVMLGSCAVNHGCGLVLRREFRRLEEDGASPAARTGIQKGAVIIGVTVNLAVLGLFKYFNFAVDNLRWLLAHLGLDSAALEGVATIALPVGISFYTFQAMSYTIDVYRRHTQPAGNFVNFACYVTLFPQLIAGPIVRYHDLADQLLHRSISTGRFVLGLRRFITGLAKKVLVANTLAAPADQIFALGLGDLSTPVAWLGLVCYTLQIYFDFSGYSDMAIGLGHMLGFTFPENFNYPYVSRSIREFWRRWHISLSTWLRDYLYVPLGGSRGGKAKTYVNLCIVFLLCGLWHGASWTFVLWGLLHGAFMILERLGLERMLERSWQPIRHIYVLGVVMVSWILFRADSLDRAMEFGRACLGLAEPGASAKPLLWFLTPEIVPALVAGVAFSLPLGAGLGPRLAMAPSAGFRLVRQAAWLSVFVVCVVKLCTGAYNPFIYYRF